MCWLANWKMNISPRSELSCCKGTSCVEAVLLKASISVDNLHLLSQLSSTCCCKHGALARAVVGDCQQMHLLVRVACELDPRNCPKRVAVRATPIRGDRWRFAIKINRSAPPGSLRQLTAINCLRTADVDWMIILIRLLNKNMLNNGKYLDTHEKNERFEDLDRSGGCQYFEYISKDDSEICSD